MPFGYSDNGSRRLATRAQAGLRTYFQPQGKPYQFKLVQVPIPLEAYGATNPCDIWIDERGEKKTSYLLCINPNYAKQLSTGSIDGWSYAPGGAKYQEQLARVGAAKSGSIVSTTTTVQPVSTAASTTTTADTTKTSVDLAQYAPLAEAAGALLGTVASTLITKGYETKQTRIAAEAAAAAAPQTVVYQTYTKGTGEGLSGTTIALIAGAVVVVGGIVYFATQGGDEEEVEEEGAE